MRQISGSSRPENRETRERRLWPRAAAHIEPLTFRRNPLLIAALCFALGEAATKLSFHIPPPTILLFTATCSLVALTLVSLRQTLRLAALPVAALWIAAGLWSAQIAPAPPPQTQLLAYADGLNRRVQGRVTRVRTLPHLTVNNGDTDYGEQPAATEAELSIDLDLTAIEFITPDVATMVPIRGGVRATLYSNGLAPPSLHCGDLIEAPMRLRIPERYRDPGAWQYADYLLDQGIAASASVNPAKLHRLANTSFRWSSTSIKCRLYTAQSWAAARLFAYTQSRQNQRLPPALRLNSEDAGMLNAMLFGDRSRLDHTLRLGFERTGSFHLFVVSGMHVALLAGGLIWFARRVRLRKWIATPLILAVTAVYAALTGFGVPVQRALLMLSVFLIARLLSRGRNVLNAVGAAALAVLVWSPRALFEASFQMTFLAIVAIAGIAIPLGERSFLPYAHAAKNLPYRWIDTALPPRLAQFRVMLRLWSEALGELLGARLAKLPAVAFRAGAWAGELILIGAVAECVMVLPMAMYFHRATVFALPANMLSIPLVGLLAPMGIATFLASLLSPWLAAIPGAATALLLHGITSTISRVSHIQAADLRVPGPTIAAALLSAVCVACCCWAVRRSRRMTWAALAALPLAAAIALWPAHPHLAPDELEVTAIDVGQGDSLLVVGPTGRTMLVDAGGPTGAAANAENAGATSFDVGEEVVSPYLWSRQLRRLDVLVLTHAHSDHMGGMPAVLRNFRPRELWVAVDSTAPAFRALIAEAAALQIPVRNYRAGNRILWDGVDISVLAPAIGYNNTGPPANNDSLVMHLQFVKASVLLEGDAEAPSERTMIANDSSIAGAQLGPVTLLKVGHHGSRTSTTPAFLALAAPQDAVISVGRQNTFGHPRPEIIARIAAGHTKLYRTDEFGLTTFLLQRDGRISAHAGTSNP